MANKCTSRKAPCETSKICNPTSGRCVVKTGKIGMALLKGGNVQTSRNVAPSLEPSFRRVKKEDIIAEFPPNTENIGLPREYNEIGALNVFRRKYGPSAQLLTKKLAEQLIHKKVYMVHGQGWDEVYDRFRAGMLVSLLIHKVDEDGIESTWGDEGENDYIYFTPYEEYAVTGSGSDLIFVFVKPKGSKKEKVAHSKKKVSFADKHGKSLTHVREIPARGSPATTTELVHAISKMSTLSPTTTDLIHAINATSVRNTSVRKSPTTGKIQAVPKAYVSKATGKVIRRGAPAAHAKNHKDNFGTGLDGLRYQSLPTKSGVYRWKKV